MIVPHTVQQREEATVAKVPFSESNSCYYMICMHVITPTKIVMITERVSCTSSDERGTPGGQKIANGAHMLEWMQLDKHLRFWGRRVAGSHQSILLRVEYWGICQVRTGDSHEQECRMTDRKVPRADRKETQRCDNNIIRTIEYAVLFQSSSSQITPPLLANETVYISMKL